MIKHVDNISRVASGAGVFVLASALAVCLCCGCGWIADKDRIQIAEFMGEPITRGNLFEMLRNMPDDERPHIKTKGDMLRVVNRYLDRKVKSAVAEKLAAQGKVLVPRERAVQRFIAMHPGENYELLFKVEDPSVLGMTEGEWEIVKSEAEVEIDRIHEEMKGDAAVAYLALEALRQQQLEITEEEYEQEYALRKDELTKPEQIRFRAIRFKTAEGDAEAKAAEVRRRLDEGEDFDAIVEEFRKKDKDNVVELEMRNDATAARYNSFWMNASGCEQGNIVGPVYMPAHELVGVNSVRGKPDVRKVPECYMVFKVLEHSPARPLTLEEAKLQLTSPLLVAKMMDKLRDEYGVRVYEDKLPDPTLLGPVSGGPVREQF